MTAVWRIAYALWRPWAIAVVLPLIFFASYLGGHVMPFGDDILVLNFPLLSLLAHGLRAGRLVLWNPYSGGGYPLAPFSALPFYAPTWLLAILPVVTAMSWMYVLDLIIGGLGAYALAAQLSVSPVTRLIPAVAFPFSGFVLAHLFAGHFLEIGLMCWFPVALAALHHAMDAPTIRTGLWRGLLCGGPIGMLVLANGVSWLAFVGYPLIFVALALSLHTVTEARRTKRPALYAIARAGITLSAAGAVGALLSAVVVLPVRELLGQTVRGEALNYHALTRISEPSLGLAMSVAPTLFGSDATHTYWFPNPDAYFQEVYAYAGLAVLTLALAGSIVARHCRNVPLYALLAFLSVVLALGANTPFYGLLYHAVPGLDTARVPARWLLLTTLSVAVLSGVGADKLIKGRRSVFERVIEGPRQYARLSPRAALTALTALVLLGVLGITLATQLPHASHHAATIGPALERLLIVAGATAIVILIVPQLPRLLGATLLLILVTADLWTANGPLVQPLNPAPYYTGAAVDLVHTQAGTGRIWALDRSVPLRLGMLDHHTLDVQDFAPLTLLNYWRFINPGRSLRGVDTGMARADMPHYNARIASLLGVSVVLAPHPLQRAGLVPLARLPIVRWGLLRGDWSHPGPYRSLAYVYRVPARLPFAQPLYVTRTVASSVLPALLFDRRFDPQHIALLDGRQTRSIFLDPWDHLLQPRAAGPSLTVGPGVTQRGASENGAVFRAKMQHDGVLLLDQIYDPNWMATVDGHFVPLRRADYLFTAVPLPAGTHTVVLVYAPPAYALGALLTLVGYAVLLTALIYKARLSRRLNRA